MAPTLTMWYTTDDLQAPSSLTLSHSDTHFAFYLPIL